MVINKKGQGMSTSTIILLILGLAVLAVLLLGFTIGWSKISPFLSTSNVDTIATSCETACSLLSTYDYCTALRDLKDVEGLKVKTSCAVFSIESSLSDYGIKTCSLSCKKPCEQIKIDSVGGSLEPVGTDAKYDVSDLATDLSENVVCVIPL